MIIQFKPKSKTNRVEALMKGQIDTYKCTTCDYEFEVYFDNKPDKCPNCGLQISWPDTEEEVYDRTR